MQQYRDGDLWPHSPKNITFLKLQYSFIYRVWYLPEKKFYFFEFGFDELRLKINYINIMVL